MIARGDGSPLYNFAVAVDDADMGITDVVRGDDHLSNTPKQLLVLEALGADAAALRPPAAAARPRRQEALQAPRRRLRRRSCATPATCPAAVRNYLALLGWGTDDDTTLMSTDELVERFRIERSGRSSAIFDEQKLRWMNGRFMRELPLDELRRRAVAGVTAGRRRGDGAAARRVRDRPGEGADAGRGLAADPLPVRGAGRRPEGLGEGDEAPRRGRCSGGARGARGRRRLRRRGARGDAARAWSRSAGVKPKQVFQPLRVAITGTTVSPGIFESLAVLGRDETLARIERALERMPGDAQSSDAGVGARRG